jgi:hypothetical protein
VNSTRIITIISDDGAVVLIKQFLIGCRLVILILWQIDLIACLFEIGVQTQMVKVMKMIGSKTELRVVRLERPDPVVPVTVEIWIIAISSIIVSFEDYFQKPVLKH